tara:strand:- start:156 stop:968 length:813 start_codon:yes stop_codon:yes gene_type:complete
MSDELQNDEPEVIDSEIIADHEDGADLATDSDEVHEDTPHVDEEAVKQEAIQKTINKKHFEAKEAERKLKDAEKQILEFQTKEREQYAAKVGTIPDMPDPFDDDYDVKMKQRDEAIIAQANFNQVNQNFQQQQQHQQQQVQAEKQQQLQTQMQAYNTRTKELGISQEELQAAGNTVAQYGISDDLTMAILADSDGPLLTKYLAANPTELSDLSGMNPLQAAMHIERNVRAKATALKPRTTNAPKPSDNLRGKGAKPANDKYKHISGAKFE